MLDGSQVARLDAHALREHGLGEATRLSQAADVGAEPGQHLRGTFVGQGQPLCAGNVPA